MGVRVSRQLCRTSQVEGPAYATAHTAVPTLKENLSEAVWRRVANHQGELFQTVRGLPFTFEVEGTGIWFFREGERVNRKLARTQFEVALSRCPPTRTTGIKDLMDYPYVFAV